MGSILLVLIFGVLVGLIWKILQIRNPKVDVVSPQIETPVTPGVVTEEDLIAALSAAWGRIVHNGEEPPDIDFGVLPGHDGGYVGAPWCAYIDNREAIVDPTVTGPVVYYFKDDDVWMLTATGNSKVGEEFYTIVHDRLLEIAKS